MNFAEQYARKRGAADPDFKALPGNPVNAQNHELRAQLIQLRLSLGLTQKEFADLTGVQQSLISRLENGNQNITIGRLQNILVKTDTGAKLKIETDEHELISH
ncbi:helix-turn-helix domain-containing protein [Salinicoccus halodurans]|uniref:Helix-turn-helix n=1 Tax=Salinicoccus halodurans TaxID=407035 RepID=A0AA94HBB0_9STAP|nr:helix-turn-helix transcriptional regulator [Salinicoccus halodurans]SFK50732.1 Helix-turn-helix [Salinicoccus halodurans]